MLFTWAYNTHCSTTQHYMLIVYICLSILYTYNNIILYQSTINIINYYNRHAIFKCLWTSTSLYIHAHQHQHMLCYIPCCHGNDECMLWRCHLFATCQPQSLSLDPDGGHMSNHLTCLDSSSFTQWSEGLGDDLLDRQHRAIRYSIINNIYNDNHMSPQLQSMVLTWRLSF